MKIRNLTEQQIKKAQLKGELDNLAGSGKPLPRDPLGHSAEAIGYRIMVEAGAIPEELRLRKLVKEATAHLAGQSDPALRKAAMAELARLQLRLSIQEEARRKFEKG